ncbi:hypothetical protein Q6304_28725, partial [Klebsiella pneumoniae]
VAAFHATILCEEFSHGPSDPGELAILGGLEERGVQDRVLDHALGMARNHHATTTQGFEMPDHAGGRGGFQARLEALGPAGHIKAGF